MRIIGFIHPPHSYKYPPRLLAKTVREEGTSAQEEMRGLCSSGQREHRTWHFVDYTDFLIIPEKSVESKVPVKTNPAVPLLPLIFRMEDSS